MFAKERSFRFRTLRPESSDLVAVAIHDAAMKFKIQTAALALGTEFPDLWWVNTDDPSAEVVTGHMRSLCGVDFDAIEPVARELYGEHFEWAD